MKRTASKNQIFAKTWKFACLAVLTGLVGVACEREGNGSKKDAGTISLRMMSGVSQKSRIKSIDFKDNAKLSKREKITYVATILPPEEYADCNWSATSVAVDPSNLLGGGRNIIYVTWHSNRQAENQATAWGGAIDVLNVLPGRTPEITSYIGKKGSSEVKFNHVLISNGMMFVSGTSWKDGGTIARIPLNKTNGELIGVGNVECIGFPGSSVNAVAEHNGKLIAISGYKGTYAEFAPDVEAKPYDYEHQINDNVIEPATEGGIVSNFGGKYVVSQDGKAYILYCGEGTGILEEVGSGKKFELGKELTSNTKMAETYNPSTGEWDLADSTAASTYYGKHTVAIKDNKFAYVACGTSGLAAIDLENNTQIAENHLNNTQVTGLCIDEDKLYAATSMGLRIYTIQPDGHLELYAFEVETYDEEHSGRPTSSVAATTGTAARHSANYVAVDPNTGYIYMAYGQSGVRIYKIEKGIDMGGSVLWYPDNVNGFFAWGEIFHMDDPQDLKFTYNGKTFSNGKSYNPYTNKSKKSAIDYRNFNGYKFNNRKHYQHTLPSGKNVTVMDLMKYTWQPLQDVTPPRSEDGLTELEAEDDAVRVRVGDGWRMPTEDEWKELIDNCTKEVVHKDGKPIGVQLTAKNGNTLFLSNVGYYGWSNQTFACFYWSSSLWKGLECETPTEKPDNQTMEHTCWPGGICGSSAISNNSIYCFESKASCFVAPLDDSPSYMERHDRCIGMALRPVKTK